MSLFHSVYTMQVLYLFVQFLRIFLQSKLYTVKLSSVQITTLNKFSGIKILYPVVKMIVLSKNNYRFFKYSWYSDILAIFHLKH